MNDFASRKMDDFAEKTVGRSIGYIPNQSKIREDFVSAFVANCKSAAEDQKKDIANAVYRSRMFPDGKKGGLVKKINEINEKYTAKKSKFIARNETGNLNAAVQRSQMEGAGFEMYTWMSMPDGVTRDTHRAMNGLVCRWDDPTVYSDDGGKTWHERKGSMFIGQPGQDYNCRCTAVPFDPELEDDYEVKEAPEEKPEEKDKIVNFEKNLEEKAVEFKESQEKLVKEIEKEVFPQTDEEKLAKARASGLYTEKELNESWPAFLEKFRNAEINKDKQNRHIVGTYDFNERNAKNLKKDPKERTVGQSFFDSSFDIYQEIKKYVGTGILIFNSEGKPPRETVKLLKEIGYAGRDRFVRTDVISIRYSGTGIHAVPVHPNKYKEDFDYVKKKSR